MDRLLTRVVLSGALALAALDSVRAQSVGEAFNLTEAVRAARDEGLCGDPEISGKSYNSTYSVSNAFDGVTVSTTSNMSKRWLGSFKSGNADGAFYALYGVPDDFRPGEVFVLESYTLHRCAYNDYDQTRVPTQWAIFGVGSDGTETLIAEGERSIDAWGKTVSDENRSATFLIPSGTGTARGYRAFKFVPYTTASSDPVNFALFELEYTVRAGSTALISSYSYDRETRQLTVDATLDNPGEPVDLALETIALDGTVATNSLASGVESGTFSYTLGPLEPGSWHCTLLALGNESTVAAASQDIYTGAVTIEPGSNASAELGQSGTFTISRSPVGPSSARLDVPFTTGGAAVSGKNYAVLPAFVTIPAGAASVTLSITPIPNRQYTEPLDLSITLSEGDYTLGNATASISILPPSQEFYHWTYANGVITCPENGYTFTVTANGNRLTITDGIADSLWPALNLDDPVFDTDGNPYTIVSIQANNRMHGWSTPSLVLPRTLELVTSYSMSAWEKLQHLEMHCPNLSTIGYAFLSGFGKTIPLKETVLEDWDLSGLVYLGGGSLNSYMGYSGINGTLVLPKLVHIGDNSLSAYRFKEIRLESPDLLTVSNSFLMSTLTNVFFATTNTLTLGPNAVNNGKTVKVYVFDGRPQPPANLDILTSLASDWQIAVYASRAQGWTKLDGLVQGRDAVCELLTEEEQTLYAARLDNPDLLGAFVTPTTGRKVWLIHRASPYDKGLPTLILFR